MSPLFNAVKPITMRHPKADLSLLSPITDRTQLVGTFYLELHPKELRVAVNGRLSICE